MVEQQTWVTLLGFAGFGLALFTYLGTMSRGIHAEIAGLRAEFKAELKASHSELKDDINGLRSELHDTRTELKSDIAELRTELKSDLSDIRAGVRELEQRTYDLARKRPAS